MLVDIKKSIFFFPITLGYLTSGILTTKVLRDFQPGTSLQSPPFSYLPTANTALPKLSQHAVFVNQALDNGLEDVAGPSRGFAERQTQGGHSYLKPLSIDLRAPFKDQQIKLITDKHRSPKEIQGGHETATSKKILNTSGVTIGRARSEVEHHPQAPRRTSYQVVEERDEYRTDNSDHARLPYREKVLTSNPHRNSQDITAAIKALDHFLTGILNGDSYNSGLHPPPSPVLALVLSRYGRYVLGARNPRLYAHMAVNNIHNNKPFGSYKVSKYRLQPIVPDLNHLIRAEELQQFRCEIFNHPLCSFDLAASDYYLFLCISNNGLRCTELKITKTWKVASPNDLNLFE